MSHRATLEDVARRAGVSVGTASRALNGTGPCAPATRDRVLRAATELHFAPNGLIRALQTGATNTVGICFWSLGALSSVDSPATPLLQGIALGVAETRRDMLVYSNLRDHLSGTLPSPFLDRRVDGLICVQADIRPAVDQLGSAWLPTVVVWESHLGEGLATVDIDNVGGAAAAVDHLARLGHRRIALDGLMREAHPRARAEGYRRGLERNGIEADPDLILAPKDEWLPVEEAAERLLSLPAPPTAIFVSVDKRAFQWMATLNRRGWRVPADISLVGFDDAPGAAVPPGLTTVRQPYEEIGRVAAQFVDRMIQGEPAEGLQAVLPTHLVVRGSTAPPRGVVRLRAACPPPDRQAGAKDP